MAQHDGLTLEAYQRSDTVVIQATGSITDGAVPRIAHALTDACDRDSITVVLDLAHVTGIPPACIDLLVDLRATYGDRFRLGRVSPPVAAVLEALHVDRMFG